VELDSDLATTQSKGLDMLAVDEAVSRLALGDPQAAELVKLRYFAGFSITQAAEILGISRASAYEQWSYARAWLQCAFDDGK
jgi:DNA-directed RNA polymerase specialized sigma24 family protein